MMDDEPFYVHGIQGEERAGRELTLSKYDLALTSIGRVAEILNGDSSHGNYLDLFHPCN